MSCLTTNCKLYCINNILTNLCHSQLISIISSGSDIENMAYGKMVCTYNFTEDPSDVEFVDDQPSTGAFLHVGLARFFGRVLMMIV